MRSSAWIYPLVFGVLLPLQGLALPKGSKAAEPIPQTVTAWVTEIAPNGDMRPLKNTRCTFITSKHRPGPHGGRKEVQGRWHAFTDNLGRVQFESVTLASMERGQLVVPFQGVAYRSEELSHLRVDIRLRVFHVRSFSPELRMRGEWTLELSDSQTRVTQVVHIENPTRTTIDYTHSSEGFRVPTLSHGLQSGRVLTHGLFPPGPLHGDVRPSTGQGRIESHNGAVVFRGPVLPGDGLFFRIAYDIPYSEEAVQLTTVADVPIREAVVSVVWTHKVHPRVRLNRPHRAMTSNQGGFSRVDFMVNGRMDAGTPLQIQLDRLPVASRLPRWVALGGGIGIVGMLFLLLLGVVLRRGQQNG